MKLPSFQFYPGDWRKDANLARASLEARGALIEILILAFESEKRGVLQTSGKPWSIKEIAQAIPGDNLKNEKAIHELLELKVLKKNRKNAIYSSRMCKDEKIRKVRREAGLKGGNPLLVKQTGNQKPTPSSSASSSASTNIASRVPVKLNLDQVLDLMKKHNPNEIKERQLYEEAGSLIEKYDNKPIENLLALVQSWMKNVTSNPLKVVI